MAESFLRPNESMEQLILRCTNLSSFSCSEREFLWVSMGPVRLPLREAAPVSAALLLLFLTGAAGNAAVCLVIVRRPAMHTATNYYLFSLAVSDLLLLLFVPTFAIYDVIVGGLPNDLSVYWHQYPYSLGLLFCKLRALISEAASYVSVLTIVAFSLERYLAICHPLHLYAMAGLRRALRIVAALWAVSLLAASPFAYYTTISYHEYPPGSGNYSLQSAFCGMLSLPAWPLCELSSLLFFALPAALILCLYVRMGLRIRHVLGSNQVRNAGGGAGALGGVNGSVHGEARQAQSKKSIIRMLAAVVVAFFVCWAPFHFQRLFFIYGSQFTHYQLVNQYLFSVAGVLYYVSATVNPILYNVMSHRYKTAFRETLCCGKMKRSQSKYGMTHSSVRETTVNYSGDGSHLVRSVSRAVRVRTDPVRSGYSSDNATDKRYRQREKKKPDNIKPANKIFHPLFNYSKKNVINVTDNNCMKSDASDVNMSNLHLENLSVL